MDQRKKIFVDRKVQGALLLRVIGYWICCVIAMATALLMLRLYNGQARFFDWNMADFWHWYGPATAASLLILILVVIDIVRFSNRFVGPLQRLRREMRHLAAGETAKTIQFRKGDFWQEFADEFNAVAQRIELIEAQANQMRAAALKISDSDFKPNDFMARLAGKPPALANALTVGASGNSSGDNDRDDV